MEQKVDELMEAHSGIQAQLNIRNEALINLPKNLAAAIVGNDNEKMPDENKEINQQAPNKG